MSDPSTVLRFGAFELDAKAGELRRSGDLVKLAPQPFKVLEILVRWSGEVVTRDELRSQVWCGDTFVDFDQGLNFCIRQIREALGDTAGTPHFIETLPRRGYRFLLPVEAPAPAPGASVTRLMVLPFRILRPDHETDFLAFSLPDAITSSLAGVQSLVVRSSLAAARFGGDPRDLAKVAAEANVDVIVAGNLLRAGDEIRVSTELTEVPAGTLLWSHVVQVPVGDVFRAQDELTHRIVESLSLPLTAREKGLLKRDVPSTAKAYDFYLRGNQLSYDSKQWSVARDLYLRAVEEDPRYAPAWARLGRIHHVMSKFLGADAPDGMDRAEHAFGRALELNPDLAIAHKLYAQFEVDCGRAHDAMARLADRAPKNDPEVLAGLVSTCRYCGLLDASLAAHDRARALDPHIRTSVMHTWFLKGEYGRVAVARLDEYPYIAAIALVTLGRTEGLAAALAEVEKKTQTRLRDFIIAARTLVEGDEAGSLAAIGRIVASDFRDPEGLFYLARHLAHLGETTAALKLFERVVNGGYSCFPAMAHDAWLDPLRKKPAFTKLLRQAESRHDQCATEFRRLPGGTLLAAQ